MNTKELGEKVRNLKAQLERVTAEIEDTYQRMKNETEQADQKRHAVDIVILETRKKSLTEQVQSAEHEIGERETFFKSKEYKDYMRQIAEHEKALTGQAAAIRETIDTLVMRIEKSVSNYSQYVNLTTKCEAVRNDEAYFYLTGVHQHLNKLKKRSELLQALKGR